MTPYYSDDWLTIHQGDCRAVLATMPAESVHCVVTSPPYWGLRDYGTATWDGGDADCDHAAVRRPGPDDKSFTNGGTSRDKPRDTCRLCGARRVDSQLGLEPTPDEYVASMVAVFREVRRVLRADGTVWLNLGDSYASPIGGNNVGLRTAQFGAGNEIGKKVDELEATRRASSVRKNTGLAAKQLVGIPWLVARALQEPFYAGRMKREGDRRWLAAMIDGEGSISGFHHVRLDDGRPRTGVHLYITNSSTALLDEAARIWPASRSEHERPGAGHLGTRDTWRWIVHGIANKTLAMRELYPYLIAKRRQALLAYNLLLLMADAKRLGHTSQRDEVRDKRQLLVDLISRANHGGTADVPSWCVEPPSVLEPGWYLRSDIIWSKPNPMPESVTDRPTKAHEYLFLLSKSARYFYDADAVRGAAIVAHDPAFVYDKRDWRTAGWPTDEQGRARATGNPIQNARPQAPAAGRNLRSVWTIATQPYPGAHFATFPEALVEPCVKAGTSEKGVCPECGAPWMRVVSRGVPPREVEPSSLDRYGTGEAGVHRKVGGQYQKWMEENPLQTTGWRPSCAHDDKSVPAAVLDPFAGSGTTARVAQRLSRRAVLIDLNADYLLQAMGRNRDIPLGLGA